MLANNQGEEYFLGLVKYHKGWISVVGPRFLRLFENYPVEFLQEIISACITYEIYDFSQLREYLRKQPIIAAPTPLNQSYHSSIATRDLRVYAEIACLPGGQGGFCHANG